MVNIKIKVAKMKRWKLGIIMFMLIVIVSISVGLSSELINNNLSGGELLNNYQETKQGPQYQYEELSYVDDLSASDDYTLNSELHWGHMPLVYKFNETSPCSGVRLTRIKLAFEELERVTDGKVSFVEGDNPDITITCTQYVENSGYLEKKTIGQAYINETDGNVIKSAGIEFFPVQTYGWYPRVEIHEILHTFGFEHNVSGPLSIMSPTNNDEALFDKYEGMDNKDELIRQNAIDSYIIQELRNTYYG
jgi:hypothetical protein